MPAKGKSQGDISTPVVRRLPRYYRYLSDLLKCGVMRISSLEMSRSLGFTPSQIRQDLSKFGGFGQQGYGYNVELLQGEIGKIIGVGLSYKCILVGVGNMGHALANHIPFNKLGFSLTGIFDKNPAIIGHKINGLTVLSVDDLEVFTEKHKPRVAILAIPPDYAVEMAERLLDCGIVGFWSFTNVELPVEGRAVVEYVHLSDSLMTLCYSLREKEDMYSRQTEK